MKYTKEQRLDIGRRIYDGEITKYEAARQYGINSSTARDYMRMYRDENQLPPKKGPQLFRAVRHQFLDSPRLHEDVPR